MNINSKNYETYFLDYIEGRLDPLQSAELLIFVEQHPQLKDEFESLDELGALCNTNEQCNLKSFLKKNPNSLTPEINPVEEKLIDYLEGEPISENTFLLINRLPSVKKSFEQLKHTRLEPDDSIIYTEKKKLKKNTLYLVLKPAFQIAAIFIIVCITAAALVLLYNQTNTDSSQLSGNIAKVIPHTKTKITPNNIATPSNNKTVRKTFASIPHPTHSADSKINSSNDVAVRPSNEKLLQVESIAFHTLEIRSSEKTEFIAETRYEYTQLNYELSIQNQTKLAANDPYLSLSEVALKTLTGKSSSDYQQKGSFLWNIADASISGINKITGSSIQFDREATESGTTKHFALGNLIEYSKK
ncbi:MAG: hypothetical protein WCH34_06525 [Bacteroidota bacterium]